MLKQNHEADQVPSCFGKMFDGSSPECRGGHDPAFYNDNPNSKNFRTQIRDTCDWISSCSARMQATQQIIPVTNLTRPQPANPFATKFNPPTPTPVSQPWRPPVLHQPQHAQQGQYMMATNYGIPQYLSVREPQTGSFGGRLAREVFRSMMKGLSHTIAHFFDVEIFGSSGGNDGQGHP